MVWRWHCAAHDVGGEGCIVTAVRHRLLLQRGKVAGRQLGGISTSSRGHAYELMEHKIHASMVRKSAGPTERSMAKKHLHRLKTSSEKTRKRFGLVFCKAKPPKLEHLKTRKGRGTAVKVFSLLWAKVCVVG